MVTGRGITLFYRGVLSPHFPNFYMGGETYYFIQCEVTMKQTWKNLKTKKSFWLDGYFWQPYRLILNVMLNVLNLFILSLDLELDLQTVINISLIGIVSVLLIIQIKLA